MSLESKIAFRYLRSRRSSRLMSLITVIAAAGVTVGVMALIVVLGVVNGLQDELREKILVAYPHIYVLTSGEGLRMDDWESVVRRVKEHPDVIAAAPFVITQSMLRKPGVDYAEGANVLGIVSDTGGAAVTELANYFRNADLDFSTSRDDVEGSVVLGYGIAGRMSALPGDRINVISPGQSQFSSSTGAFMAKFWSFEVNGDFQTGMFEYDNGYVIMPFEQAQEFAGLEGAASGVQVRVTSAWDAARVADELEEQLGGYPYFTRDWQEQNASLFAALKLEKLGMGLVQALIVLVAAFNIVSTLTMTVTDKTREIGILRAMGMSMRSVRRVFILQGAWIGVFGTLLGTSLGLIVAYVVDRSELFSLNAELYLIDHLPVAVDPFDVAIVIPASIAIAIIATVYPARRAAALHPVEAIRYE